MASNPLIIVDITAPGRDGILAEFGSDQRAVQRTFMRNDGNVFDFLFVKNKGGGRYEVADLTNYTIQASLGETDEPATGGTFDLAANTISTNLTGLAYNITGSALETALNSNAQVSGAGGVTVTQYNNSYKIVLDTTNTSIAFTSDGSLLTPNSYASLTRTTEGDVGIREVWWLRLVQKPLAYTNEFTLGSSGSADVDVLQAGTSSLAEVQRISLSITPQAGSVILNASTRQEFLIRTVADVSGSLHQTGIIIEDANGTVGVWMDVGGGGTAPAEILATDRQIEITTVTTNMTAANVATQWQTALDADSQFVATVTGNVVRVRQAAGGQRIEPTDVGTGFTFDVTQDGLVATATINVDAEATTVAAALGDIANITKSDAYQWDVTFRVPGDQDLVTVSAEALFQTVYTASMPLDTDQTFARFASEDPDTESISVPWEISLTPLLGKPDTIYRVNHEILRDVITNDVSASNPLPTSITSIIVGNTVFVDQFIGDDSTGLRERMDKPFATPAAAVAAAVSGDVIEYGPGSFTCTASLAKDGVDHRFPHLTRITMNTTGTAGIWDDGGTGMTFRVTGNGLFTRSGTSSNYAVIRAGHADSEIYVEYSEIEMLSGPNGCSAARITAGSLTCAGGRVIASGTSGPHFFRWAGGTFNVSVDTVSCADGNACVYVPVVSSPASTPAFVRVRRATAELGVVSLATSTGTSRITISEGTFSNLSFYQLGTDTMIVEDSRVTGRSQLDQTGTLRFARTRIDSTATTNDTIGISAGTLILEPGNTLLAHASHESIDAGSAKNVVVYPGNAANKAVGANITQLGSTLTVSSSFV